MKKYLFCMLAGLVGLFIVEPLNSFGMGQKSHDVTPAQERRTEQFNDTKTALENLTPEEKEEIKKEIQKRKSEREILMKQRKEIYDSLTDKQKEVILSFLESLTKLTPRQKDIIKSMLKKKRLILENLPPEKKEEILNKLINFAKLSPLERDRVLRQLIRNRR